MAVSLSIEKRLCYLLDGGLGFGLRNTATDLSVDTLRSQTGTFPYDTVPSRALEDMNPSSKTFGTLQSAADYEGAVSVWYFTHATCSLL